MTINGDYPHPITVNGYACKNCTDVDYAKKHVDPAHPKDGPYGIDAKPDHKRPGAIRFGGQLAGFAIEFTGAPPLVAAGPAVDLRV